MFLKLDVNFVFCLKCWTQKWWWVQQLEVTVAGLWSNLSSHPSAAFPEWRRINSLPHPTQTSCPRHPVLCCSSKNKMRNFAVSQTKMVGGCLFRGEGEREKQGFKEIPGGFSKEEKKSFLFYAKLAFLAKLCQNMVSVCEVCEVCEDAMQQNQFSSCN